MGKHSTPGSGDTSGDDIDAGQGRRRRIDGGRRGVSAGVIAALVAVVVLVGGIILWRFFGDALSRRSSDAASQCLNGTATVAVLADPSIAEEVAGLAEQYNAQATPIGDSCVNVMVKSAGSDAVVGGLTGTWPDDLGERPALWIPASSIGSARLQSAVGPQIVSDARSLVTSPLVLAMRPELATALGQEGWPALPGLQSNPASLDAKNLPGWGSLRLALPTSGAADAAYLAVEAVAMTSAPPNTPATAGLAAAGPLLASAPRLGDATADTAWSALTATGDPAAAPVHAVAMTEQQLYRRTGMLEDAAKTVAAWFPTGPVAMADYPTVLLSGSWLSPEQVAGASEFARFMRGQDQLGELVAAGFRTEADGNPGDTPEGNDVVTFGELGVPLPIADDAVRAAVAGVIAPASVATTTVILNEGLTGDEGGKPRLANVAAALRDRIAALPPGAAVGLWTYNRVDSAAVVPTGPLSDPLGTTVRSAALGAALDGLTPTGGSGLSFTTLRSAYGDALTNYRPGQPNSILLIAQGPHTDQTLDGAGLQGALSAAIDRNRPLPVDIIGFPGDPDRPTWEAVATLTGGTFTEVPSSDSPELTAAVARGLS